MRLIDGDKLLETYKNWIPQISSEDEGDRRGVETCIFVLEDMPTVDAVEVVRCRDCEVPHNKYTGCPNLNGLVTPHDFYCPFGERKDGDGNG